MTADQPLTTPAQGGSTDATARWIPQQCPGPSPEWPATLGTFAGWGFDEAAAEALTTAGYGVVGAARVQEIVVVASCAE